MVDVRTFLDETSGFESIDSLANRPKPQFEVGRDLGLLEEPIS